MLWGTAARGPERPARLCLVALAATCWLTGCAPADGPPPVPAAGERSVAPAQRPAPPAATAAVRPRIVVLGDSLTAGLGLSPDESYPTLLQRRLDAGGFAYDVVNAGVSGDTSAGGLSRLDWALEGDVRVLIVALGGNDALRALPPDELRQNLSRIIERAQARHIRVLLAGMEAPRNFGRDYIVAFHQVYPALARQYQVPLVPFLLEGVAADPALNQRDGIHPTAEGARLVANNVWTVLKPLVAEQRSTTRKEGPAGS
jgi:acyl-CoA thioesterase-1